MSNKLQELHKTLTGNLSPSAARGSPLLNATKTTGTKNNQSAQKCFRKSKDFVMDLTVLFHRTKC